MSQKTKERTKNPFLTLILRMADARGESPEDFSALFHYSPGAFNKLEDNPWFNPSERTLKMLQEGVNISREEERAIMKVMAAAVEQDEATQKEELHRLYDLMPRSFRPTLMDSMRRVAEAYMVMDELIW
jgi:hypothetical protein